MYTYAYTCICIHLGLRFTEGGFNYQKARKIVYQQLEVHSEPKKYLNKICDVLSKQDDQRLRHC